MIVRAATPGRKRLTAGTVPRFQPLLRPSPTSTISRLPRPDFLTTRCHHATFPIRTMLRGAVLKHEKENVKAAPSVQKYLSSSPPELVVQSVSSGYRNPLGPAATNGVKRSQVSSQHGVKRTANGLAKIVDGSFEDHSLSQQKIAMANNGAAKEDVISVEFGEDDFDSDIDLDVEDPATKFTVSYPKLPKQPKESSGSRGALHPTLPRQAQASAGFVSLGSLAQSECMSVSAQELVNSGKAPHSSQPLPWSSSPDVHHMPSYLEQMASKSSITSQATGRPVKHRLLPWQMGVSEQTDKESAESLSSKTQNRTSSTPLPKDKGYSSHPWNTTASAMKQQQKQHRAEVRKNVKSYEGTEEEVSKAKTARMRPARVFLSEEQQHVLDLVLEKNSSVFFTGSAGTGKSVLMREIIAALRKKYQREPDRVAVTASTGLAACNVGGVTLHSFAGIGLGKEDVPELVRKIKRNQKSKQRWMRTKVLVVDEVSMVDGELFDKLEAIARQLRNNGRPFGGIQLVVTGDFFQLPPVPDKGKVAKFAFDAATWTTTIEHTIVFAGMLNEMREGRLSESSIKAFRCLSRKPEFEDDMDATELFPTRNEVDRANNERLWKLQGVDVVFEARDGGSVVEKDRRDKLLSNCMAPERIVLKKGAQVMLIKNVDDSLVNGSPGRVLGFMDETTFDRYHESDSNADSGDPGEGYEEKARSRVITTSKQYPVVRFTIADGTTRDLLCQPETWKVELPNGEVQASRMQVPLILAWALSIHKAQGQTLERVKVDLGKVFEKGQAYVALSRATSMAGLQVLNFDPKKVNAHARVGNFYANLSKVDRLEKKADAKVNKSKPGWVAEDYEKRFMEDEWADS
nr:atp-dependent dna helicase pif1 [Quercus suber]